MKKYITLILTNLILRKPHTARIFSYAELSYFFKPAGARGNIFWKDQGLRKKTIVPVIERSFIDVLISFVGIMRHLGRRTGLLDSRYPIWSSSYQKKPIKGSVKISNFQFLNPTLVNIF